MKISSRSTVLVLALSLSGLTVHAQNGSQMSGMSMPAQKSDAPMPSPPATAEVKLADQPLVIHYNTPHMRGRKIFGGLVPYGQEWRTGANPATTLITPVDLLIGDLKVPAGTYTLFTLPSEGTWQFIVSTKTGEWGIPYPAGSDLGRTAMSKKTLSAPQEAMSLSFEHTAGNKTELHIKWETTDVWVPVVVVK